jgi:hypothetical protein
MMTAGSEIGHADNSDETRQDFFLALLDDAKSHRHANQ